MVVLWRAFRYQTGEVKEIAEKLKQDAMVEVDIDQDEELDELIKDLKNEGIYKIKGLSYDYEARHFVDHPEFWVRIGFYTLPVRADEIEEEKILYIDFFKVQEIEDKCLDLFF